MVMLMVYACVCVCVPVKVYLQVQFSPNPWSNYVRNIMYAYVSSLEVLEIVFVGCTVRMSLYF